MARHTRALHFGPAPWLRPVLEEWCEVIFDYCRAFEWEDVPWWYGERSAVGLLAAALTRSGWVVLEEFSTEKVGNPAAQQGRGGRQDLQAVKRDDGFMAEAKNNWTHVPRKAGELARHLQELLGQASADATAKEAYDYRQLAVVFTNPKVRRSANTTEATREWCEIIDGLEDCARAWVMPRRAARFPEGTELDDPNARWGDYIFPGTAVIIRECPK